MISWTTMLLLAVGVYGQRLLGMVAIDTSRLPPRLHNVLGAVPLAIIAAVVALQTATSAGSLVFDARAFGLGAAAICAWRRLPLAVVVVVAAAVTGAVRAFG